MRKSIRLQSLLMIMAAISLAAMLVLSFLLLTSLNANLNEQKRQSIRERVEMAESLARHYETQVQAGRLSRKEAQSQYLNTLRQIRTGGDGYFWVNDTAAYMVVHPYMPELEGKDISYIKDADGKSIVLAFVDMAVRHGSGFVAYSWPKPNTSVPEQKLSYVKLFGPWQWVIGSGEYLDDIHGAYWNEVRVVIPVLAGVALFFMLAIFWLRRQVLVRIGSDMQDAVTIADHLSRGDLHSPIALQDDTRAGPVDTVIHLLQAGLNVFTSGALMRRLNRRKQADGERQRLSEALKQSQEAIALAEADLQFAYVNPAFTRLFGYTAEELVGRPMRLLQVVQPGNGNPEETARMARESGLFRGEVLRRAKDGRDIPVLIKMAPVFDEYRIVTGYVATMTDLSEIKHAEAELRESEEKFRAIFDQTFQFIGLLDIDGRTIDANRTALALVGRTLADVVGKPFWDTPWWTHSPELQARLKDAVGRAAKGEFVRFEAFHPDGEGRIHHVDFSIKPVRDADGRIEMLIPEGHDISERKVAETEARQRLEEISRINADLKALNTKLTQSQNQLIQSEKMAAIGVLAAGVAHEINNPVGFIQSNICTLGKYVGDFLKVVNAYEDAERRLQDRKDAFADVHRLRQEVEFSYARDDVPGLLAESADGLARVTKIVKDLKDFSRLDMGEQWKVEDIHMGLESTLNIAWNELKYKCEIKKEYGCLPPVECLLLQLDQVFMNLLVNAAHAIEGHGTITLRTGTVGDRVWIEVADTGTGIPPENIKAVFDPFFTTKPVGKGTGLGLSVSYSIIEKHHGNIEVESELGRGTTFRIWLPIRQPVATSGELGVARATDEVVVDHAGGLHVGVHDGGADEAKAAPLELLG